MNQTLAQLNLPTPPFPVDARSVEVLTGAGPRAFYELMRRSIRGARRNISIASLYLGTGEPERTLVADLVAALDSHSDLRAQIVLDYSRGQRRTPTGTSLTALSEVIAAHPEQLRAFVHRMPQLRGLARWLPSPLDECIAVFHLKALVFDDTTILTGANLNDEYFEYKQARYIVVRDPCFAQLMHDIVTITSEHSMALGWSGGRLRFAPAEREPVRVVDAVLNRVEKSATPSRPGDTALVPVFQHPGLGIRQESSLVEQIFARPHGKLAIATPYTNFPPPYVRALAHRLSASPALQTTVIGASGNSHSFTTGRGLKALVPGVYRHRERAFLEAVRSANNRAETSSVDFRHYEREGWVFHSKGVWLSTDEECATVIGSSSFGERSYTRDFDMSCLLCTRDPQLCEELWGEVTATLTHAPTQTDVARRGAWTAPLVAPLVKRYF